jgi:cell wall-associated NlpC family hydrolase
MTVSAKVKTAVYTSRMRMKKVFYLLVCCASLVLAACSSAPIFERAAEPLPISERGQDVAFFALSLIDTGYRFGGKNPEAGLDCSGMVSYIFGKVARLKVSGSAADIARAGRPVERASLRPGDLVFFNTRNAAFSHVGVYIGDDRFVHAPSTSGKVRIDQMADRYYAQRFEAARSYFD